MRWWIGGLVVALLVGVGLWWWSRDDVDGVDFDGWDPTTGNPEDGAP